MQSESVEIEFEVPGLTPQSGGHYKKPFIDRRSGKMRFAVTKQATAFKYAVAIFARGCSVVPNDKKAQEKARYSVELTVVLGPRQRGDADNFLKLACDSLQYAGVIDTDAKMRDCKSTVVRDDRENPRTIFKVRRLES